MTCIHCGLPLTDHIGNGLSLHANGLQRCQRMAPYGHMGHPTMPCPSGTVNDCLGATELGGCDHIAAPTTEGETQ